MKRAEGLTAGVFVLGAALLHPGPRAAPAPAAEKAVAVQAASAGEKSTERAEGPWIASCNHWAPSTTAASGPAAAKTVCDAEHWGIPPLAATGRNVPITAVIATLPDPVHSSLSLDFDRLVDAMTQAAADNSYLVGHYWLPWSAPNGSTKTAQTASGEDEKQVQRERQPGLLILKPAESAPGGRLIYLFLVAQTPALGINGEQMRHALAYEEELKRSYGATLSVRDPVAGVDVIGPNHSGSAHSLRAALLSTHFENAPGPVTFHVVGTTSTMGAAETLMTPEAGNPNRIEYVSFGENTFVEQATIGRLFASPPYGHGRLAFLGESGTAYGSAVTRFDRGRRDTDEPVVLSFPREISLLRNAQKEDKADSDAVADADRYLHLSLKNSGSEDTIAHFSTDNTPYSQESQWMSIVRELKARHVEVVSISASNVLDELFLAKYLHRDLPDARLVVFEASDLLFARLGDNAPYIGTIAATAYPLVDLTSSNATRRLHDFASTWVEQYYNAVSYVLWNGASAQSLSLSAYDSPVSSADGVGMQVRPPPLWMTVVGRDGYYPLTIVDRCSSNSAQILPVITYGGGGAGGQARIEPKRCEAAEQDPAASLAHVFPTDRASYPGFSWYFLCLVVTLLCAAHTLVLRTASFWSPLTRELAIDWSDEPRRRAVYLHIAAAMLFSLSVVVAVPAFFTLTILQLSHYTVGAAVMTLAAGVLAAGSTLRRTLPVIRRSHLDEDEHAGRETRPVTDEQKSLFSETGLYPLFDGMALLAAVFILVSWCLLCWDGVDRGGGHFYVGVFFAYRCLFPASGVSPAIPVLLILFSWYLWAFFQTKRLRFSANSRPMLPQRLPGVYEGLYVPEEALTACSNAVSSCLFENVTCLLITRQLIRRVLHRPDRRFDLVLIALYAVLFAVFLFALPIRGLDHFLRRAPLNITLYQFVISALFYPLLVVALTGFIRMLAIWTSLRAGLLEPLERSPLRWAFSGLTKTAWMTMFKQNGVFEYFRGMARSNQSIRQLTHSPELATAMASFSPVHWNDANAAGRHLEQHIAALMHEIEVARPGRRRRSDRSDLWKACGDFLTGNDLPLPHQRGFLNLMCAIERDYSSFSEALLAGALIPYWTGQRMELVEAEAGAEAGAAPAGVEAPKHIRLAEEFLALRYLSLIRTLLINLRQLMSFISISFVLALVAWNSYPFQPRQDIDWIFTGMLFGLGSGVIWIFAQMHRDPILSRITGTEINQLGASFWIRLTTFGAVPVLTWFASQFPEFGSGVLRLLQSGMQMAK